MIVPFNPEVHARFVFSAWCNGAGEPFERLHDLLRHGARCAIKVGQLNREVFMGYAVVTEAQTVAWCYSKERLRGKGIMRALLEHLGVDLAQPTLALFRSPACDALITRGWPIAYVVPQPVLADARRTA